MTTDVEHTEGAGPAHYPTLSQIESPADLKKIPEAALPELCAEIRSCLIENLSVNPGHFGSSMGAVDIIVALHYVFDTPRDRIVFDVGHQAYAHKLLTGRRDAFATQRTLGGISGFPFPAESEYDTFVAGHASNSISAALGMAIADLNTPGEEDRKTVALIGDASIGGGLAFEGLNNASINLYIAVTPYETRNITSCAIAKKLGARKTVARIDNSEFLKTENRSVLREIGIDHLIYPENLAANEINMSLTHNWARYWGEFHDGKLLMIGVKIHSDSILLEREIKDLPVTTHDFHIAAVKRNNETLIPHGNTKILADDIVYFITTPPHIQNVREMCGKRKRVIRNVMINGGGRIAMRFAKLHHDKFHIKILEQDLDRCEELATALPDCEIVHGDGRDVEVLRENSIDKYDAFLALTESSETNILTCMNAKEFGIPKTIAEVENLQFFGIGEYLNIGTIINKKLLASSRIFQILLDADETDLRFLALADAEVAEIDVKEGAKITKAQVKDLRLPQGMTLAALVRDEHVYLINGLTRIQAGDYVVVFSLMGTLQKIEKWFN